jgi:hypothetical protein
MPDNAIAIPLPFWQDPQGSLALEAAQATCTVFFPLWSNDGEEQLEQIGKITFTGCWAISMLSAKFLPYSVNTHVLTSYLLEIVDSDWLLATAQQRLHAYPGWKNWDKATYRHYLVQGTDKYVEVLATHFTTDLASPEECRRYAFLKE